MGLKCGIVGLPNVGKSTLFNALTGSVQAAAENYPFCTIDPNVSIVNVPDERLYKLAEIRKSQKIIQTQIEFVDIAGLVEGASKGEGLGNKFLANIREVDAIAHVVRCFEDDDVTHVNGSVDPLRDIEVINTELILSDIESLERQIKNLEKKSRQSKEHLEQLHLAEKLLKELNEGKNIRELGFNFELVKPFNLLTHKPVLYICNVEESDSLQGNNLTQRVSEFAQSKNEKSVFVSAKIEQEISSLDTMEERQEFLKDLGMAESGLSKIIKMCYETLNLCTYFTVGEKEARAWTFKKGTNAQNAAGIIHTDFAKGFICAETISYEDYVSFNGMSAAKENGKLRQEGREYVVQDGDVLLFRFNV